MAADRYRWQALLTLRRARRSRALGELADARKQLQHAQRDVMQSQEALRLHRNSTPTAPAQSESDSALELQRMAAFAQRHTDMHRELRAKLDRACAEVARRHERVSAAQAALASASADERVIEQDKERALRMLERNRDNREQAELEERESRATRRKPLSDS